MGAEADVKVPVAAGGVTVADGVGKGSGVSGVKDARVAADALDVGVKVEDFVAADGGVAEATGVNLVGDDTALRVQETRTARQHKHSHQFGLAGLHAIESARIAVRDSAASGATLNYLPLVNGDLLIAQKHPP